MHFIKIFTLKAPTVKASIYKLSVYLYPWMWELVCVCATMPAALRGPHVLVQRRLKVNWKLLIWPFPAFRFGLEGNIYIFTRSVSPCTACFSSISVFISTCISPSVFPPFQFTGTMSRAVFFSFFNISAFLKMISRILHTPAALIIPSLNEWTQLVKKRDIRGSALRSALTFSPASVESHRCGYNDGTPCWKQLCCTKQGGGKRRPWQVCLDVSFLMQLLQLIRHGKCTIWEKQTAILHGW